MAQGSAAFAFKTQAKSWHGVDFATYRRELIHETKAIEDFLSDTKGDHFIISAPKGFGKTLLLIAKRKQIEETEGYHIIFGEEIVENLGDGFHNPTNETLRSWAVDGENRTAYRFWADMWSICIMIAVIKRHYSVTRSNIPLEDFRWDSWTKRMLDSSDRTSTSTAMIFKSLLHQPQPLIEKALSSYYHLERLVANISSQFALFIDSVDQYLLPLLSDLNDASSSDFNKQLRRRLWTIGQISLACAAYRLHTFNSHIKVFCTIRQEAFKDLALYDSMPNQIRGYSIAISYTYNDFREIFTKNIRLMQRKDLALPDAQDPMERFFGQSYSAIKHRFAPQYETCFNHVLRHTFFRPRDLMYLGAAVAEISAETRGPNEIRAVIRKFSDGVVEDFTSDMKHFFVLPIMENLLPLIHKNYLTPSELEEVQKLYIAKGFQFDHGSDNLAAHPFCVWFKLGMLGKIRAEDGSHSVSYNQRFIKPTDMELNPTAGLPPTENYYLVHPALDNKIAEVSPNYFRNYHPTNIIGYDTKWIEPPVSHFVVHCDAKSFSKAMEGEFYRPILNRFHRLIEAVRRELEHAQMTQGDHAVFISKNAFVLISCIREFAMRANSFKEYPIAFRFAGSAGPVEFLDRGGKGVLPEPSGMALQMSARLEPYAPVGFLLVDQHFRNLVNSDLIAVTQFTGEDIPTLSYSEETEMFSIQIKPSDPVIETKLYGVRLEPDSSIMDT